MGFLEPGAQQHESMQSGSAICGPADLDFVFFRPWQDRGFWGANMYFSDVSVKAVELAL